MEAPSASKEGADARTAKHAHVTVALDWTPNTNHIGMYVAKAKGWYDEAGVQVEILPATDPRVLEHGTPARMVAAGAATFAVAPTESLLSFATTRACTGTKLVAVATLLQKSTSSIAVRGEAKRIADLQGKRYGTYSGRFEDEIIRTMVRVDGGDPSAVAFVPLADHGYSDAGIVQHGSLTRSLMATGEIDSTWIFSHWEGVRAKRDGFQMTEFRVCEQHVPYPNSPALVARAEDLDKPEAVGAAKRFLAATARGYQFAAEHPQDAAALLVQEANHQSCSDSDFVAESAEVIADSLLADGVWGEMCPSRWERFVDFLFHIDAVHDDRSGGARTARCDVSVPELYTNRLLPSQSQ